MSEQVVVASVNFTPGWHDTDATLAKMKANIAEAASQGADIVVFPEGALRGCGSCAECAELGDGGRAGRLEHVHRPVD